MGDSAKQSRSCGPKRRRALRIRTKRDRTSEKHKKQTRDLGAKKKQREAAILAQRQDWNPKP
jgi:hypothetical protein